MYAKFKVVTGLLLSIMVFAANNVGYAVTMPAITLTPPFPPVSHEFFMAEMTLHPPILKTNIYVTDTNGVPMQNAQVTYRLDGSMEKSYFTDSEGKVQAGNFKRLEGGVVTITAGAFVDTPFVCKNGNENTPLQRKLKAWRECTRQFSYPAGNDDTTNSARIELLVPETTEITLKTQVNVSWLGGYNRNTWMHAGQQGADVDFSVVDTIYPLNNQVSRARTNNTGLAETRLRVIRLHDQSWTSQYRLVSTPAKMINPGLMFPVSNAVMDIRSTWNTMYFNP